MRYLLLFTFLVGCETNPVTILPTHVSQSEASFDGMEKNSGIKEFIPNKGFVITDSALDRYQKLAIKFGDTAIGVSKDGDKNYLTNEGMIKFLELNDKNLN